MYWIYYDILTLSYTYSMQTTVCSTVCSTVYGPPYRAEWIDPLNYVFIMYTMSIIIIMIITFVLQ